MSGGAALFGQMGTRFECRLRSDGTEDVVVTVDAAGARLVRSPDGSGPSLESDPAARLLLLWGRRPADPRRIRSDLDLTTHMRLAGALRGF